jgi:uncharacterized protein (TIGR03435 family)
MMKAYRVIIGMLTLPLAQIGLFAQDGVHPGDPAAQETKEPWQVLDIAARKEALKRQPPQVKIVPSTFPPSDGITMVNGKYLGTGVSLRALLRAIYDTSKCRIVADTPLPEGIYDVIANLPGRQANAAALRKEIETQFHLVGRTEKREADVLQLTVKNREARGLKVSTSGSTGSNINAGADYFQADNVALEFFAQFLEHCFEIPVVDSTGMAGRFNIDLKWNEPDPKHSNRDALKGALLEQLGLELLPGRKPIELLIVEKMK